VGKLIASFLVVTLVVGCGPRVPPAPTGPSPETTPRGEESGAVAGVNLPEAVSARQPERGGEPWLFLNVNSKGDVLLAPVDRVGALEVLGNPNQIRDYLRLRADEEKRSRPANEGKSLQSVIILRVDKETPFEKTNAIMKACAATGFLRFQLRAMLSEHAAEGQFPLTLPDPEASAVATIPDPVDVERVEEYAVIARATETGTIGKITLRSEFHDQELGADIDALFRKLKEIRERDGPRQQRKATLVLEIDGKLRHEHVIRLIDTGSRMGFSESMQMQLLVRKKAGIEPW
jgi:biopolymer transport protein ExbD